MRTRILLMLAFGILARARDAGAQPAPPCPGGQSTGVVHVYSECRPDGFWHAVTDEYFMCPAGRAQSLRINDVTTDQPCGSGGAPQPTRARLVQELVPGRDAFPERMGHFIFLECINGYWHRVWYLRYRLPNGEFRYDRDAVHIERTDQPCGSPPPPVVDPNRGASVASAVSSRISIAKRAATGGAQALLIEFPALVSAKNVTEVRLRIPRPAAESAKIAIGPERWSIVERGNQLRLTGPGVSSTDPLRLRLDIGRNAAPNEVETELYADGKSVARERVKTATAPPPVPSTDPDPLIALPPTIVLTEPVVFTPLSPDLTPPGGTWTIGGVDAKKLETPPLADPNEPLRYRFSLGESAGTEWKLGASVGIRYKDKWGDMLLDSPGTGTDVAPPPPVAATAGITDCTKKVFQGRILCVCGWFPESVRGSLMLGSRALGYPVSSTFNTLYFRVPQDVAPVRT